MALEVRRPRDCEWRLVVTEFPGPLECGIAMCELKAFLAIWIFVLYTEKSWKEVNGSVNIGATACLHTRAAMSDILDWPRLQETLFFIADSREQMLRTSIRRKDCPVCVRLGTYARHGAGLQPAPASS